MKVKILLFITVLLLSSCTMPKKINETASMHNTPSGRPEVLINGYVAKEVRGQITNMMLSKKFNVKNSNSDMVVFEKPFNDQLLKAIFGSKYDETPYYRVTFNFIESFNKTRVVVTFAAITNPGSAFEKIEYLNNFPDTAKYQESLNIIKQCLEAGP